MYGFAEGAGLFAFSMLKVRREETLRNIARALELDNDDDEVMRIARGAYMNAAVTFIEMLVVKETDTIVGGFVDFPEADTIRGLVARGKGIILVSCHMGSWEMTGATLSNCGFPVVSVAKAQSNPYVTDFIARLRTKINVQTVELGVSSKRLIRMLSNGEGIGLISDQDAGRKGVFVDFFGRPASTPRGAAQLALKYDAPVVVVSTVRTSPGKYRLIWEEVPVSSDDTVESLTQRYTAVIETMIRNQPDQYFWMHRRWKTRPFDENVISDDDSMVKTV